MALSSHQRIDSSMPGKETDPHAPFLRLRPPPSERRPCRLSQPSLSLFLPIQSAQPPTICDPSRTASSSAHLRPLRATPPSRSPPLPLLVILHTACSRYPLFPTPRLLEQLSGYELTELRSFCGGRASSYAAYRLQNCLRCVASPLYRTGVRKCRLLADATDRYRRRRRCVRVNRSARVVSRVSRAF